MSGFCLHCGKELNDDDMRCPDCGAVTEKGKASGIVHELPIRGHGGKSMILPVVLITILLVATAVLVFPLFTNNAESYTVTVTIESLSVNDAEGGLYTEDGYAPVAVSIGYSVSSPSTKNPVYMPSTEQEKLWKCKTDGTEFIPDSDNTITFKMDGNKNNFVFTVFLLDCHKSKDIIDIYDDRDNIVGKNPAYIGATGVSFNISDLDENGKIVLTGDSDPIGSLTMTVNLVKN